jgi:mono/diheme cytochrome c family protein
MAVPAFAGGGVAEECVGCHTPRRTEPQSRFSNGLGRWNDSQCYGCHAELNDVALKHHQGLPDRRYIAVPVREDKLKRMATTEPLSYMGALEGIEDQSGAVSRISQERLAAFLKRPSSLSFTPGSKAPRMMAYPSLQPRELSAVAKLFGVKPVSAKAALPPLKETERRQAEALWTARCVACHGGEQPVAGRSGVTLGLYTPEWLSAYAWGKVRSPRKERTMPVVALSLEEARLLHRLFGEMREEAERTLDERVSRLKLEAEAAPGPVPAPFIHFLWGRFFREATCVHCHATSPRAASAFTATPEGLKDYLRRSSGHAFWLRLETRALEDQHGLVAARPGMPMAGGVLPQEMRALIARWVLEGCKDPQGQVWCQN